MRKSVVKCSCSFSIQRLVGLHGLAINSNKDSSHLSTCFHPLQPRAILHRRHNEHNVRVHHDCIQFMFLSELYKASIAFDPICKALGVFGSSSAIMATAFAGILYVLMIMKEAGWLNDSEKEEINDKLLRHVSRITSDVYYLSYISDPFCSEMHSRLTDVYGVSFIPFYSKSTNKYCHQALNLLLDDDNYYTTLMNAFMSMLVDSDEKLDKLRKSHPRLVWGQLSDTYPSLSKVLCENFSRSGLLLRHRAQP